MIRRTFFAMTAAALVAGHAAAQSIPNFPADFTARTFTTADGANIHVRVGGKGPAVVLIHGFTQTGEMWGDVAVDLSQDFTVIAPDLRGIGESTAPHGASFAKSVQAQDIATVAKALEVDRFHAVIGHDIGSMVAYAFAAQFPDQTDRLVLMEAPLPGVPPWDEIRANPRAWHLNFHGPTAEALVAGRERIYLDRFWTGFSSDPALFPEEMRTHYARRYAEPGVMAAGMANFAALGQDAEENAVFSDSLLTMPVLAVGGEVGQARLVAMQAEMVAENVTAVAVPGAAHWLTEEAPQATLEILRSFLSD